MTITDTNDIIALTLLNVTIMAADRRGGRRILNSEDFIAYKTMLGAADAIGPAGKIAQTQAQPEAIEGDAKPVAKAASTALPQNRL
jgi:hypothetical protein